MEGQFAMSRLAMESEFANDALYRQFEALLGRCHLDPTNVIDAVAAYSLTNWQIVNGETTGRRRRIARLSGCAG